MQQSIVVSKIHIWRNRNNRDMGIYMDWPFPQHPVPLTNDFLCSIWYATIHTSFFHNLSVYKIYLEHVLHNKPIYSYNLIYSILSLCNLKQLHMYKACRGAPWINDTTYMCTRKYTSYQNEYKAEYYWLYIFVIFYAFYIQTQGIECLL